jgi:hypothetical protein
LTSASMFSEYPYISRAASIPGKREKTSRHGVISATCSPGFTRGGFASCLLFSLCPSGRRSPSRACSHSLAGLLFDDIPRLTTQENDMNSSSTNSTNSTNNDVHDRPYAKDYSGLVNQAAAAGIVAFLCLSAHELMKRKRRGKPTKASGLGSVESWEFG